MTNTLATQGAKAPTTIKGILNGEAMRQQIALALPKHLTAERFIRIATTAMTKTPGLAKCTQESFFGCLLSLSSLGLEPDGRRAHLIPYGNTCTLIIDFKGLAELAMRSGVVSNLHADVVCENDAFDYDTGEVKSHKIDFRQPRGEMYAAYAICTFKDGTKKAEVMSRAEIEGIRNRSKAGKSGPWVTDFNEMAKKTVFRRLSKWLPLSPEYRDALEKDGDVLEVVATSTPTRKPARTLDDFAVEEPEPETYDVDADGVIQDGTPLEREPGMEG